MWVCDKRKQILCGRMLSIFVCLLCMNAELFSVCRSCIHFSSDIILNDINGIKMLLNRSVQIKSCVYCLLSLCAKRSLLRKSTIKFASSCTGSISDEFLVHYIRLFVLFLSSVVLPSDIRMACNKRCLFLTNLFSFFF